MLEWGGGGEGTPLKLSINDIDGYISKSPTYSSEFQESILPMSCETYEKQKYTYLVKKIQANSKSEQILFIDR
jgi:hypothetical protein